jgi:putative transposase
MDVIQDWRRRFAMSACIALRDDYDSLELRRLAKASRDPRQVCRLLALAAAYDGMSRGQAAKVGGMDRQTLRDWAHRFNEEGPEGLKHRSGAGRPRLLTAEQMSELSVIVETGPDPEVDGVVRWRRVDLQRVIEERFGVTYRERTISDLLAALSFSHISARPRHPGQDERVIEAFKKTSPARWRPT